MPEAYLSEVRRFIGNHPEFHFFIGVYACYPQLDAVDRDFAVGVRRSLFFDAEDILCGLEGGRNLEGAEEMVRVLDGPLKPRYRYLPCGTVTWC